MNKDFIEGVNYLKKNDITLEKIINKTDQIKFEIKQNKFESLVRIIISQQLSNESSNTIIKRVENKIEEFIPEKFISLKKHEIRKCGVSNSKYNCIKLISNEIIYNGLDLDSFKSKSEDYIFNKLNSLKGIGPWSINMFLIFGLGKLNIFPIKDVGIQNSIMKFYSIRDKPSFEKMMEFKNKWDPYCSVACLYLWNSYDNNNKFNRINFNHSDRNIIVNAVIRKLGLKNKFELNDRMEGIMFLDKHLRRVFSCNVVEKEYNISLTSKEKPLRCSEEFIYNDLKHKIVFPNSKGLIKINGNDFEILIVVVIDDSYKSGYIKKTLKKDFIKKTIGKTITVKLDSI